MRSHWYNKFANALRGIRWGVVGQSSFYVHLACAAATLGLAAVLRCEPWQWCMLGLCVALVLSLELINSAIETLAKELCHDHNEQVGRALDIVSGAVLVASFAAALIGLAIFVMRIV